jgi:hypothetical protein
MKNRPDQKSLGERMRMTYAASSRGAARRTASRRMGPIDDIKINPA